MTDEERLLSSIVAKSDDVDFALILVWLSNIRAEYLKIWRESKSDRLEHFQGRYAAIDDILIYLGQAEQKLRKLREKK